MATDFVALQEPFGEDAIRTVNFFNGRLLTGNDMGREQAARREADARIGLALGDGIANGLQVVFKGNIAPGGRPAAEVQPGAAVNQEGVVLCLKHKVQLALDRAATPGADNVACLFGDCAPLADGDYVAGAGLYLLTIAPAFTSEGRAAVSGMGDTSPRCALDATVEAVQFRLLEIRPELHDADPGQPDFRNRIAYEAFGAGVLADWPADLLGSGPRLDDLLETMRGHGLDDAEVPLALIAFNSAGHIFTDSWSVRRPIGLRDPEGVVSTLSEPRRLGVGRAMFRQFQDEISSIMKVSDINLLVAKDRFRYLPPVGLIPTLPDNRLADFFKGMTVRGPLHIDASAVEPLLRESFAAPVIDTDSDHAIWLYRIAQTRKAGEAEILVFASGHLPYRGDARFNLNYWNYANYPLIP
ncbi:hypothetical protein FHS95_000447 [Sphingomonas naasensis]|uniref:Uncharacterized protein n=1 Tax=Sphingomonas naasensis TaxID=1344951 RepID=A0A4S1WRJ2_9SPHN|nr:hypothetical protein [Sphingomonas naasensis]NIJ18778.1 hypothetical protein [Sphingomonas naasensis]TGX46009.1 hypothetical protein E5A74_02210 [Sphingomonas naasensis]